jgi:hypothetical protein
MENKWREIRQARCARLASAFGASGTSDPHAML